jgi:hypothetical protein
MLRSKEKNTEEIKIQSFTGTEDPVQVDTLTLPVPLNASPFALAALLMGFEEHFLIPSGQTMDAELKQQVLHNLKLYKTKVLGIPDLVLSS